MGSAAGPVRGLHDPRRPPPDHAVVDEVSAAVLDEATLTLTLLRAPMHFGDALAELHAMVSLRVQIDTRLAAVVAAARDQDHSWAAIAAQLGLAADSARARYQNLSMTDENTR